MTKTVGIIGGLGTEASCSFCLNVNHKVRRVRKIQPHLVMDNVPVSQTVLEALAHGEPHGESKQEALTEALTLLENSVKRLNTLNVKLIVIPCNTVHVFIDQLRRISTAPILSIIEETAEEGKKKELKKIGLLASTTTVKAGLYEKEFKKHGIELVIPNEEEQNSLSESIVRAANSEHTAQDKEKIHRIIEIFKEKGAEAVILGCTDLFLLVSEKESVLPIINSTEVLENATAEKIMASAEN